MSIKRQNIFWQLYDFVSYWGINNSSLDNEVDQKIMFNRYFILLWFIFLLLSFCNLLFLGLTKGCISLFFISLFCGASFILLKKFSNNPYFFTIIFTILTICITYYSSFCGLESGVFLYYFPMLYALPIFFTYNKDKKFIIFLSLFILLNIYLSAIYDFQLVERSLFYLPYSHKLLIINITCVLLLFAINSFFLEEKRAFLNFMQNKDLYRKKKIQNLTSEITHLRELLVKDSKSEDYFNKLIDSIQLNDSIFIENFKKLFPSFFQRISKRVHSPLTISDLKLCAFIKLNFTTKQIAIYTNSTIKSVESKKYRLRKKLKAPKDINITDYLSKI
ncbi:MAG: hypothetical protein ACK5IC_03100 [Moheibacter sp.]